MVEQRTFRSTSRICIGSTFSNIYINDLFYPTEIADAWNCAEDTTIHACDLDLKSLITRLEHGATFAMKKFESNYLKLNQDKCHFLFSGRKYERLFANVGKAKIRERKQQNFLGVFIEREKQVKSRYSH